jgi:hypothetical protein
MVHEPVHIVYLFTAHSVNFFEFQIIVIYLLINKQLNIYLEYNIDLS